MDNDARNDSITLAWPSASDVNAVAQGAVNKTAAALGPAGGYAPAMPSALEHLRQVPSLSEYPLIFLDCPPSPALLCAARDAAQEHSHLTSSTVTQHFQEQTQP